MAEESQEQDEKQDEEQGMVEEGEEVEARDPGVLQEDQILLKTRSY